ncbi:three-helix bundle dimerization domain-containing protein [Nonomuraea sp. NPDC005692]|uniref:three-helix bundle dimerization domain-containing protein n=1 Tax=Nonomuraea sp. NPDC005692 TaxID=3157168 RepID=UPI0033DEA0A7
MDSTYRHADLTVDQQHALLTAARTLAEEFAGTFGTETIERFLHTSYDQFAGRAVIADYLPLLAERFARQRLRAPARVEGKDDAGVEVMHERGIDITGEFPKPWTSEIVQAADVVVTMGCGDACPVYPGQRYLDWDLDDPDGKAVEQIRPIRDDIERRVRTLLADLEIPTL